MADSQIVAKWTAAGNLHLLKYFRARLGARPQGLGRPASYLGMKMSRTPNADASAEFIVNVKELVAAKNRWIADMVDIDHGEGVPSEIQQAVWTDYLGQAEAEIARERAA